MTEMHKNNIKQWVGSIIASIIVFMIGFSVTASREDSKELRQIIDSKVDKTDFEKKCEQTDLRINILEQRQVETLEKISETMNEMSKQNATMQNDIVWIKKALENKPK